MSAPVVLRNRRFAAVWVGQFLTQAAARLYQVGIVWWLVGLTNRTIPGYQAGVLLMAATLPAVLLVPLSSRLIARWDRRWVLAGAAGAAGTVGLIAATCAALSPGAALPFAALCLVAIALASCQAVFDPCLTTSIPELVEDEDIEAATSFQLATQSVAGLAGGFLGPLIVESFGARGLLAACVAVYLAAAGLVGARRFPHTAPRGITGAAAPRPWGVLRRLPTMRIMLLCFTAANFFTTAVFVLMPLFARTVLHTTGAAVSVFEAALSAGTILGAAVGPRLSLRLPTVGGAGLGLTAAGLALPGLIPHAAITAAGLVLAGTCIGTIGVRFVSLFQRAVPAEDKPAFFTVMQALISATLPVSSLVFGVLGDAVSVRALFLFQGIGLIPVALLACRAASRISLTLERPTP
ncbi:MFS transporter [Corynebacterium mastitidis]